MTPRIEDAARTRDALLDAGIAVADREGLGAMSVNRVVAEAGLAKGTFYVHFANRDEFLQALHQRFVAGLTEVLTQAIDGVEPGRPTLVAAADAYFAYCLREHRARSLIAEAGVAPDLGAVEPLVAAQLKVMGFPRAEAAAPLVVGLAVSVALVELARGRRHDPTRQSLWTILELLDRADAAGPD